jgi:hypothetical protein
MKSKRLIIGIVLSLVLLVSGGACSIPKHIGGGNTTAQAGPVLSVQ